jgi:ABC-type branched-subunit amino acid transport system ATPase component/branched-subunit amino acid ABC-type transport system permease component
VLTYKTSGIFNFAHGAIATAAASVLYFLHVEHGWDWKPAVAISVLVVGPLLGLLMEQIARRLTSRGLSHKIVATVGLVVLVQGLAVTRYGSTQRLVSQFLPRGNESFRLLDVNISYAQVVFVVVGLLSVGALHVVFRFTRIGISMRAVVDDPDLLELSGTNAIAVRRVAWVLGTMFAAISGVLLLPVIGLQSLGLTLLVTQAFAAAAFGAFGSISLTFLGGIALGVLSALSKKYVLTLTWMSGFPASLPFLILLVVLLVTPRRRLVRGRAIEARQALPYRAPTSIRVAMGVLVCGALLIAPAFAGRHIAYYTTGLTQALLLLSLGLLVRTSGQVSLCQTTFAAVGAVAFSQLAVQHHVPWLLALLAGGLLAVPVGALVALPAARLSGLFLALATFGFGIMVESLFYARGWMFTFLQDGRSMPRPSFAQTDKAYYYVVLAVLVAVSLLMVAIHQGRLGRVLRGMSEAPRAVATLGLSVNVTKVIVFCVAAFIAGLAGVLYGSGVHFAATSDPHYASFQSVILIAILALAPFREPWYALVGALASVIPAYITIGNVDAKLQVLFGFFALVTAVHGGQPVMGERLRGILDRVGRKGAERSLVRTVDTARATRWPASDRPVAGTPGAAADGRGRGLEVESLVVQFGGLIAVRGLTMSAPIGRITGLIGPNGAVKTTTFDACSGLTRPTSGTIRFNGQDVSRLAPPARGRLGLGRTFQHMELGDALTVFENVQLGKEAGLAGGHVLSQLVSRPQELKATRAATAEALEICGITHLAHVQAGALSTGQRRLAELARCLAGSFDVLLLDEPSSGLDTEETDRFAEVLSVVEREWGCGILLVEHDMSLVMRVCEYIYVLDFGVPIFEGDALSVAAADVVRAAYLGDEEIAVPYEVVAE